MDMIIKMMRSGCDPLNELGADNSPEHEDAMNRYLEAEDALRHSGIDIKLLTDYEKALMELRGLSEERLFCFAVRYGAKLQRDLMA